MPSRGLIAAGLALLATLMVAPAAQTATPQTIVVSERWINEVVQDGNRLAWSDGSDPLCGGSRVVIRSFVTGRETRFRTPCVLLLALGGDRVLWSRGVGTAHNPVERIYTAAVGQPSPVALQTYFPDSDGYEGEVVTGAGGDMEALAFGWFGWRLVDDECWFDPALRCRWEPDSGSVTRVIGRRAEPVPNVPAPSLFALTRSRVAVAPVPPFWEEPEEPPDPALDGPVEIRDLETGALITSFSPAGRVLALALSRDSVAVLLSRGAGKRIELYDIDDGALLRSVPVLAEVSDTLDMSGNNVVYLRGRRILVLNAATGMKDLVAWPAANPIGVSIEGRRVAWGENRRRGPGVVHRIRAVVLPN